MIRRLVKILGILLIFNILFTGGLFGYVTYNSFFPSLSRSGISLTELIFHNKDLSQAQLKLLNDNVQSKAAQLGNQVGQNVSSTLKKIFPTSTIDYSKMSSKPYPYPSDSTIAQQNASLADQAAKDALQQMQKAQVQYAAASKQGLENAQNAEKTYQTIRSQTLKPE